jgi:hypothetical protein
LVTTATLTCQIHYQQTQKFFWFHYRKKNSKKTECLSESEDRAGTQELDLSNQAQSNSAEDKAHQHESTPKKPARKKPVWSPDANHGRYGFNDYPGLNTKTIGHATLKVGDGCPECIEAGQQGKLYEDGRNRSSAIG